jgi:hypothetical protein
MLDTYSKALKGEEIIGLPTPTIANLFLSVYVIRLLIRHMCTLISIHNMLTRNKSTDIPYTCGNACRELNFASKGNTLPNQFARYKKILSLIFYKLNTTCDAIGELSFIKLGKLFQGKSNHRE